MPAIKPYPMQMVRVRSSKTVVPPMAAHSPASHAMRPKPNVAAASAGLPVRSCSAARLLVEKLFRD